MKSRLRRGRNSDTENQIAKDIIETEIATAIEAQSAPESTVITAQATGGILPDPVNAIVIEAGNLDITMMTAIDTSARVVPTIKEMNMAINVDTAIQKMRSRPRQLQQSQAT